MLTEEYMGGGWGARWGGGGGGRGEALQPGPCLGHTIPIHTHKKQQSKIKL